MRRKFKRKQGPVRSKKVTVDGITFASGLEKYMYLALKEAKIEARYEGETYVLQDSFVFKNKSYEKQSNGKGEFKNSEWSGQGILTFPDGSTYKGEWANGFMNGEGTFTWSDGKEKTGIWKNGELQE